ncbi:MAG: histone family protein [Euryarchaeota archaeon]|nr:histone family protein [Euryarchaeota archaeon]
MLIIPFAPVERVIREAGAKRVSESAGIALAEILEQYGLKIAKEAIKLANHAGRKTIRAEDIELALDMMLSKDE